MIGGHHATGIAQMWREGEIEFIALIDLVDGHRRALEHLARHHFIGPRSGKYEAERDGRFLHAKAQGMRQVIEMKERFDPLPSIINPGCASFMLVHA
jgi:hypothetical protein